MSWTPDRTNTRNAEEFLEGYRRIRQRYEAGPVPRLAELREIYAGGGEVGESALLEAHVRHHLVDLTLEALNWPLALDSGPERPMSPWRCQSVRVSAERFASWTISGSIGVRGGRYSSSRPSARMIRSLNWCGRGAESTGPRR